MWGFVGFLKRSKLNGFSRKKDIESSQDFPKKKCKFIVLQNPSNSNESPKLPNDKDPKKIP
jgi:hypothetical protein